MMKLVFYLGLIVFVLIGGFAVGSLAQKGLRVFERGELFYSTNGAKIGECKDCLDSSRNLKIAHKLENARFVEAGQFFVVASGKGHNDVEITGQQYLALHPAKQLDAKLGWDTNRVVFARAKDLVDFQRRLQLFRLSVFLVAFLLFAVWAHLLDKRENGIFQIHAPSQI